MMNARYFGTRRAVSFLIVVCLLGFPARAQYGGGTGEPNDPYLIYTAEHLSALGAEPNDYDKHFKLMADIDLSGYVYDRAVIAPDVNDDATGWFEGTSFTGEFNGNGHVVRNLHIEGSRCLGLFGLLKHARISNLGLEAVDIHGTSGLVGALGGSCDCWIADCYSTGTVSAPGLVGGLVGSNDGRIIACYSTATVTGDEQVGGLAGENYGGINASYSSGIVDGDWAAGGLVGMNYYGHIATSYSVATVSGRVGVGGLAGANERGSIADCFAAGGAITGDGTVGGLVGGNSRGTVTRCYSTCAVSGNHTTGGLVGHSFHDDVIAGFWDTQTSGQANSADGKGKTTAEMQTASTFLEAGWDFVDEAENGKEDIWKIVEGQAYPLLSWQKYGGGTGEPNDPYLIYTAEHLSAIGAEPNDYDKHFKLMADIDLDPNLPGGRIFTQVLIAPLGPWDSGFTGDFDGNGHRLVNLALEQKPDGGVGLFGVVEESGAIHDLTLEDVVVEGTTDVGALTAYNFGTIRACHVSGVVHVREVGYRVGGLAGLNEGVIESCSMTGEVTSTLFADWMGGLVGQNSGVLTECVAYADVSVGLEGKYVGGLVGTNRGQLGPCDDTGIRHCYRGEISHCLATGTVSCTVSSWSFGGLVGQNLEGKISDSFATGDVRGGSFSVKLGGLVGSDFYGTIERCCATGNVSGGDDSLGLGGLVGTSFGIVTDCYAMGDVLSGDDTRQLGGLTGRALGRVSNCYAVGLVRPGDGGENIGGLVGLNHNSNLTYQAEILDCFWDIETSGQTTSAGGDGKSTAEMKTIGTFLDATWDFIEETENGPNDIWYMPEGDYPRLSWELLVEDVVVLVVDDFESYTNEVADRVFRTWIDGVGFTRPEPGHPGNGTGAMVGHDLWDPNIPHPYPGLSIMELKIVHGAWQSMPLSYDNTTEPYYSEAERAFTTPSYWTPDGVKSPQDWTVDEADALTVYFHGEADNDPGPLYVAIEDSAGRVAVVTHPDADAVLATEWRKWHIALADLQVAGVDVASVGKMIIGLGDRENPQPGGIGTIYIDDIAITRRMP